MVAAPIAPTALPLEGIRVVDLTRALAGPFCTMLLGDHGADVIKIEVPGRGDDTRNTSNPTVGTENTAFLAVNRNKRSIELDLRHPAGLRIAKELVARADVFVENMRPGKADTLGLGWDELSAENPGLVYCSISGWGSTGPYASRAGYALTAEAMGGLMSVTGERDGEPMKVGVSIIDNLAGLYAKDAITAALLSRERTGRGQRVETSLLESTVSILSLTAMGYLMGGLVPGRWGTEHEWHVPWKSFETADGHMVLACSSEGQWAKICVGIGRQELAGDPQYSSMSARHANREDLYRLLDEVFAAETTQAWLERMNVAGAAVAPIQTLDQVFDDPQVRHREMVQHVDHPTLGSIPQVGFAQTLHGTPATIRMAPPLLGQHTDEILQDVLGYDLKDRTKFRELGAIR
jgi:crotonobetainyl-CoA:carnitine CoA-transferase CaiB-like acyl-CoA transferase